MIIFKNWIYVILILNINSLVAQNKKIISKDTIKCYTSTELKAIALKLISGAECDTILKISKLTVNAQDSVINSQNKTILAQENRYNSTENLIKQKEVEITTYKKELKKSKNKLVLTKIGWAATSIIFTVITVLTLSR